MQWFWTDCNADGGILFGSKWRGKQYCWTAANALGEPADIANMTAYLLSDASKFITGRKFYVDGGRL